MLEIVIGIIFVILMLSLLATTIMELIAGLLSLRGQNLQRALKHILSNSGNLMIFEKFKENAFYKQLSTKWMGKSYPPSYMESSSFWSILFSILREDKAIQTIEDLRERLQTLPDKTLREVLIQLLDEVEYKYHTAEERFQAFRQMVEAWYNNVMDRASGWYKRSTQAILLVIGFVIAVGFDADVVELYQDLSAQPEVAAEIANQAENFIAENRYRLEQDTSAQVEETLQQLQSILKEDIQSLKSPLGLGWDRDDLQGAGAYFWLLKLAGWLVTALSITLGAPFWFDLLRKVVNIRSSGDAPAAPTIVIQK